MKKYFIISHGRFAEGCVDTMKIFLGDTCPYVPICAYVDDTPVQELIDNAMKDVQPEDELLICSDIMGGSVNQLMLPYLGRKNSYIVTGVNLVTLMELALLDSLSDDSIRKIVSKCSNESIVYMNDKLPELKSSSDDE